MLNRPLSQPVERLGQKKKKKKRERARGGVEREREDDRVGVKETVRETDPHVRSEYKL